MYAWQHQNFLKQHTCVTLVALQRNTGANHVGLRPNSISVVKSLRIRLPHCSVWYFVIPELTWIVYVCQSRAVPLQHILFALSFDNPSLTLFARANLSLVPAAATCSSVTRTIQQSSYCTRDHSVVIRNVPVGLVPPLPQTQLYQPPRVRSMSRAPSDFYRTPFVQVPSSYLCYLLAFLPSSTLLAYSSGVHCRSAVSC